MPQFEITAEPDYLEDLDIIWTLALESQNEEVYKDAITFLVNCYAEVCEDLIEKKSEFCN